MTLLFHLFWAVSVLHENSRFRRPILYIKYRNIFNPATYTLHPPFARSSLISARSTMPDSSTISATVRCNFARRTIVKLPMHMQKVLPSNLSLVVRVVRYHTPRFLFL